MKDISKYPWLGHYNKARQRCRVYNAYGKLGRKFLMEIQDFKYLWFRDKAYLLRQPSIDRIDNDGNYILSNCRFIERGENTARHQRGVSRSEEVKEKIRKALLGKPFSEKRRRNISRGIRIIYPEGRKLSEETKRKIRFGNKGRIPWNKGKELSKKTREKMSIAQKEIWRTTRKKIII